MAITKPHNLIIISGVALPPPTRGMEIISTQAVDAGRNAQGAVVGQLVGRRMWKINNLVWHGLDAETWATIQSLLKPFYVPVTFTGTDGERHTITMYPSDLSATPFQLNGVNYKIYETCKFNLIDCGRSNEQ